MALFIVKKQPTQSILGHFTMIVPLGSHLCKIGAKMHQHLDLDQSPVNYHILEFHIYE